MKLLSRWRALRAATALGPLVASLVMSACGGGGGASGSSDSSSSATAKPSSRDDAARFLAQATFGPTDSDIDRVLAIGYTAWIDEQFATPSTGTHRAHWDTREAEINAANTSNHAGQDQVLESFWKQALSGPDQLRQRMAYALSQIFVISMADSNVGNNPRAVAAYLDMLGAHSFGSYRALLEDVSRHPMMGYYLSHLRNQKANAATGRVPDENYAREVMQLFSIGLVELNADGSTRTGSSGAIETYTPTDIAGLAKVFTGWSWACPDWPDNGCFFNGSVGSDADPDRAFKPMLGYPQYHSTEAKAFLGTSIAAQSTANPDADLRTALDALAAHANVGPFIGRQLIQRFVTSNPSPAYVAAVARAFADNGAGQRGDFKAVIKAVLLHPEARGASTATSGKVREPVLRLSAYLRAFPHRSDTGYYRVGNTDNPGTSLGQTPMRSPSVFNFYRPGYVAPGTQGAVAGLAAPELQIANETTAAGFVNYMRDNISAGVGQSNGVVAGVTLNRRDLQPDFSAELALASDPAALVDRVTQRLTHGVTPSALKTEIVSAVSSITIPTATGTNQTQIDTAKRNRVNSAILLTLASPEAAVLK